MSENYTLKPAPILKVGKLPRENIFYSATSKGNIMIQRSGSDSEIYLPKLSGLSIEKHISITSVSG